jgi:Skp family chaperone for outer membrane proteins
MTMLRARVVLALVLVVASCAWLVGRSVAVPSASPALAPAPTVVGLVNLERLMNGLNELKDRNEKLKPLVEADEKRLQEMEMQIAAIESELKDVIPESDSMLRLEKVAQRNELRQSYDYRSKALRGLNDLRNGEVIRQLYGKVTESIGAFAAREGFDLIVLDDRGLTITEKDGLQEINRLLLNKRILFAKGELDVTDRLVQIMNNEYDAGKK